MIATTDLPDSTDALKAMIMAQSEQNARLGTLIAALRQLVGFGHSIIVIEYDLDLIAAADWIIDLGPEGGPDGGQILAQGTPEEVARSSSGPTATALRRHLCA